MKLTIVTCDNCTGRIDDPGRRRRLYPGGPQVDVCPACLGGYPPVDVEDALGRWPVFVRSASVRPLFVERTKLREKAVAQAQEIRRLERELAGVRDSSGRAVADIGSDLLRHTRDVASRSERAIR